MGIYPRKLAIILLPFRLAFRIFVLRIGCGSAIKSFENILFSVFLLRSPFTIFVKNDIRNLVNMISILIPTYNYACDVLVSKLQALCANLAETDKAFDYEILLADDASTQKEAKLQNEKVDKLPHCRYLPQKENRGRARIRNFLADQATLDYLLFIDCDAAVEDNLFIRRYWEAVNCGKADVICGGVANVARLEDEDYSLRYYYEEHVGKARLASERMKTPYARFTTFNFLIRKALFMKLRFHEDCVHYGYEDVFFGMKLEELQVSILHIDNALVHTGLEPNAVFLRKTETALETLYSLDDNFKDYVRVSQVALRLKKAGMLPVLVWFYRFFSKTMRRQLMSSHPSVFLFNVYKLCYYACLEKRFLK